MNLMAHDQDVEDPHQWTRFLQFLQHHVRLRRLRKGKGHQYPTIAMRVLTQTKVLERSHDALAAVAADHLAPLRDQNQDRGVDHRKDELNAGKNQLDVKEVLENRVNAV